MMLNRTKVLVGSAAAVGTVALLTGPIGAAAQEDDDPTETTTAPDATMGDDESAEAGAGWLEEVLATLVESGTLTQAQADAVGAALEDARPAPGDRRGHGRHGGPMMGRWGDGIQAAATVLGVEEETLRDALRDGQTLAELAVANGVDPQAVIDALVTNAEERIDDALAEGRIDEAEATERRAAAVERITDMVENGFPDPGDRMGHGPQGDDTDTTADTTPTTEVSDSTTATTDGGS